MPGWAAEAKSTSWLVALSCGPCLYTDPALVGPISKEGETAPHRVQAREFVHCGQAHQ